MDTIFAQASARGKAGVSVIRISGPGARDGLSRMVKSWPLPRQAGLRRLWVGEDIIDEALVLWFEGGQSFTGEESVELQCHGSPAVVQAVLMALGQIQGFRAAEPGEFTRRSLMNGRMDLAQVEGLADLIDAETEAQRRQAMRIFSGLLETKVSLWRGNLLRALALTAAAIDFADEELPDDLTTERITLISRVLADLEQERSGFAVSERIRDGFEVAIIGRPNLGKSTLLNRIAGRRAALTSEHAGTTRDVIEVRMDILGLPVTLLDTAGMRDTADPVEAMGVDLAKQRARLADLRVFLVESKDEPLPIEPLVDDIVLLAKGDLLDSVVGSISGATGHGVDALLNDIGTRFSRQALTAATITRERHRNAVVVAIDALSNALEQLQEDGIGDEFVAESLGSANRALDMLLGKIDVEDVLGEIFFSFCIGK
jgi:tRNA modification GTPase